jgi:hypothetical protein
LPKTKDAHTRAKSIAENADAALGNLKKSDMGVFQIIAQTHLKIILMAVHLIPILKQNSHHYNKISISGD